jgi:plastocyanin
MRTRTRIAAAAVAASAILVSAACGKSNVTEDSNAPSPPKNMTSSLATEPSPSSPAPAAAGPTITINGFAYTDVTVPPGAVVTVINNDSAKHTVTSDSAGAFNVDVAGNGRATFNAPTAPGSYPFHCTYHPNMHAVLTVQ